MKEQENNSSDFTEEELEENIKIEETYRQAREEDVPNLWNRIEAALPETPVMNEDSSNDAKNNIRDFNKKGKKHKFNLSRIATLVAACLCLFILVPYLLLGNKKHYDVNHADESPAMEEPQGSMFAAPKCETAETPVEEAATAEEIIEEEAPAQESPAEDTAKAEETSEEMVNQENEKSSGDGTRTLDIYSVEVEIMEADLETEQSTKEGYQIIPIKITEDMSGMYQKGALLNVYVENSMADSLVPGEQKTVTLIIVNALSSAKQEIIMSVESEE